MDIQNQSFLSINQIQDRYLKNNVASETVKEPAVSFKEVLFGKALEQSGEVKFSKHASIRLSDRGIALSESQMDRLNDGVLKAKQKGIRDSLVLLDELAFIVNVPTSTVVTAMDSTETNENVFTNINGAVII